MHLNMLTDIHVELIHTFNPLYAVPIVAVVFCAFLVYAFGFKSPVPPPSFENEKKYNKKRKNKEIPKPSKSVINGKMNGINSSKGKISEIAKKKDSFSVAVSEKTPKKIKNPSDKKVPQEKQKDTMSYEDLNDDGWVQHISKKGRKNRKKEDLYLSDTQSKTTPINESVEVIENETSNSVKDETKPVSVEKLTDNSITEKQMQPKDKPNKKTNKKILSTTMSEKLPTPTKSDDKEMEKILKTAIKTSSEDTENYKSKKSPISPNNQIENNKIKEVESIFVAENEIAKENAVTNTSSGSKSNVAFDELAGLYPETKEKKKKKVRRDH